MLLPRILTAVLLAPFVIGVILLPFPWVFYTVLFAALFFTFLEFFSMAGLAKHERVFALVIGLTHAFILIFFFSKEEVLLAELTALVVAVFSFYCFLKKTTLEGIAVKMSLTLFGVLYIGTLGSFLGLLRQLPQSSFWILTLLSMTWLNDTFAYFAGHLWGKRRLAPLISPGKTVEGFLGGFVGSFVGFCVFWAIFENPLSLGDGLILTLLVGLAGPLGDLGESLIKRNFKVKDSGTLIPGHGGILDRIDALLFTAPIVYWFARYHG